MRGIDWNQRKVMLAFYQLSLEYFISFMSYKPPALFFPFCFSFVCTYFILFAYIFTFLAILSCIVLDVSFKDIIMNFDFWWSLSPYHLVKDCNPVLFIRKINILFLLCFSMISAFLCFLAVSLFSIFHYCDYELSFFPYDSNFQNMGFSPPPIVYSILSIIL